MSLLYIIIPFSIKQCTCPLFVSMAAFLKPTNLKENSLRFKTSHIRPRPLATSRFRFAQHGGTGSGDSSEELQVIEKNIESSQGKTVISDKDNTTEIV